VLVWYNISIHFMNLFQRILLPALALSIVIYILHTTALRLSLYWIYWWFDVLLHSLTGFVLALLILFLMYNIFPEISPRRVSLATLGMVLLVAISWEVFEYINGLALAHGSYMIDTLSDIMLGVGTGYLAVIYVLRFKTKII